MHSTAARRLIFGSAARNSRSSISSPDYQSQQFDQVHPPQESLVERGEPYECLSCL